MRLSVLDLVPVRTDQTSGDALAATVRLAQTADRLGFTRYWLAEHHNMASVAATSPPVLIAHLAAQTARIRLGSGGVMLPNHAPLAVAEQFALLEAAAPGRIDLGIGRAPGSDPVTSVMLRGGMGGAAGEDIANFPDSLDQVRAMMSGRGVQVRLRDGDYALRATPAAATQPRLWLLGSSMYSARLAAAKGLPYVFAHHFSGQGTAEALALYRSTFQPSELCAEPTTFLTVNAVVAETDYEATKLALPNLQMMARLRTGRPLGPVDLVEDAQATRVSDQEQRIIDAGLQRAVVGAPAQAAERIRALAQRFDVDEVMVNPVASVHRGTVPATSPAANTPWNCWPRSCSRVRRPAVAVLKLRPESSIPKKNDHRRNLNTNSEETDLPRCQHHHRDGPRRPALIGLVPMGIVVVHDLPQPGIVAVVGQHRARGHTESLWADIDFHRGIGLEVVEPGR